MSDNDDLCYIPTKNVDPSFGDSEPLLKVYSKEPYNFHPFSSHSTIPDYKITFPPSMDTQIRKLKLSMEPCRELVLQINSILLWEKQWHSTALLAGASFLFTILWLSDPNVLTVISLAGLVITVLDYCLPIILSTVFKSETWSSEKQKQYEEICTNIILYKTKAELLVSSYSRMRVTNPKMYFSITIIILCFLTWLGGTIDNLFLTFIFITFLVMLPGMLHHGMLSKLTETSTKLFNDLVENAKSKVGQKKIQ
ncbi:ADP-ribosylation factor-like 6 interacting protein 1 [Rhynchophorus ferrugineus]|uniref:RETREG1-3/ARL6IP-like N-terminal reticulon-homology domain-containing protein n=1 Tax=Rhynchophorus ferrugineus TaxID=354439 RepID=A0A834IUM5_RHYFE|nr:hypothetical protein GWI33_005667 [Rhynchophorus ferrugineus]